MTITVPRASNDIALIKTQLEQLKELYDAGTLTEQVYTDRRSVLEQRLLEWVLNNSDTLSGVDVQATGGDPSMEGSRGLNKDTAQSPSSSTGRSRKMLAAVAATVLVAVVGGGTYFWFGKPTDSTNMAVNVSGAISAAQPFLGAATTVSAPHATKVDDISVMADKLAARLQKQPNDPQGWAILARSYDVMGNLPEALKAYAKAAELLPDDANLKDDYAKAMAKAGGNDKASVADVALKPSIAAQSPAAAGATSVSGTVTLSAALKNSAQPEDTLFVLARPQEGSRMPLAIVRKQVKDLPLHFVLDDSMGMSPVAKLSTAGKVVVVARISKSGNAAPAMGDLSGQSAPVAVGAKDLKIEIDTAVKR